MLPGKEDRVARGEQILGQVLETLEHFFIPFCLVFGKGTMPFSFHVPVVGLNYPLVWTRTMSLLRTAAVRVTNKWLQYSYIPVLELA